MRGEDVGPLTPHALLAAHMTASARKRNQGHLKFMEAGYLARVVQKKRIIKTISDVIGAFDLPLRAHTNTLLYHPGAFESDPRDRLFRASDGEETDVPRLLLGVIS
jgi:hypothetical protein